LCLGTKETVQFIDADKKFADFDGKLRIYQMKNRK